jgi:hypothetical protein
MSDLVNPGNTPQVYSKDGKSIGAGERLELDKLDTVGKAAVAGGRLVFEEDADEPQAEEPGTSEDKTASVDAESATVTARRPRGTRS